MVGLLNRPEQARESGGVQTLPGPLPEPVRRQSADTDSAVAEQTERFTRRKGRAMSFLSGGNATGGISVSRFLGSVGRT